MENVQRCRKCKKPLPPQSVFCLYCGERLEKPKKRQTRRPYSSGSVRKLSGKRSKPYAAYLPHGMGGTFIGTFATATEASTAIDRMIASRPASARADWKVKDFWNCYKASDRFVNNSRDQRNCDIAAWKYCESLVGEKLMRDMKTNDWQECVDKARDMGRSKSTISKIRNLASKLCQEAMKDDIISRNYAELLSGGGKEVKERDIFTEKEIALLKEHDSDYQARFILILIYTGMRINELLNVTYSDIHDGYIIGGEKTEAGRGRIIPILPEIADYIDLFRSDVAESDTDGSDEEDTGSEKYLINKDGNKVSVTAARNTWFYAYLVSLGILTKEETDIGNTPRLSPHCTRKTFATMAWQAGVDKSALTRVIGHTDYEITDKVYIKAQADMLIAQISQISKVATKPQPESTPTSEASEKHALVTNA